MDFLPDFLDFFFLPDFLDFLPLLFLDFLPDFFLPDFFLPDLFFLPPFIPPTPAAIKGNANDGNKIEVTRSRGPMVVKCSRWAELKSAVDFHAEFAYLSQSTSEFRLLNAGAPLTIGQREDNGESLQLFRGILSGGATGGTPLCYHITQIANEIKQISGYEFPLRLVIRPEPPSMAIQRYKPLP